MACSTKVQGAIIQLARPSREICKSLGCTKCFAKAAEPEMSEEDRIVQTMLNAMSARARELRLDADKLEVHAMALKRALNAPRDELEKAGSRLYALHDDWQALNSFDEDKDSKLIGEAVLTGIKLAIAALKG